MPVPTCTEKHADKRMQQATAAALTTRNMDAPPVGHLLMVGPTALCCERGHIPELRTRITIETPGGLRTKEVPLTALAQLIGEYEPAMGIPPQAGMYTRVK